MAATKENSLTLYTYYRSSCSARVRIALNLKNIPYTSKPINIIEKQQHSDAYSAINPSKLVPALVLSNGTILTQSLAILEYLEETYPESTPLLLPPQTDVAGRAHVRALMGVVACDIQPVTNDRVVERIGALGGSEVGYRREMMGEGLRAYEKLMEGRSGRFSYGDVVSLADVCLVPAVWNAERVGVDMAGLTGVRRVVEEMERLEGVKRGHWKAQEDTPVELRG